MGQKVHPIGFRLGISKMHLSHWFAQKEDYSKYLFEDNLLRKTLQKRYNGIEKIEISRKIEDHLEIKIYTEKTDILIGPRGENLTKFQQEIKQILQKHRKNSSRKVRLYVLGSSQTSASASFIADFLIDLLEKRIPYRRALNLLFNRKLKKLQFNGVKIQISGRLNGAEIARREWRREGALPLQTLNANIDYISKQAHTIYGILGIKVWFFHAPTPAGS
uniref:Small ribosomal subunit protein uS3c n=1 Tax=Udotea flabellum TaxID=170437 RepID=A0A386B1Z8_9CHLO|nr:ribosomal protein S3 [Udotea flabellum]AYC65658.1 ribosomal protein S3 [Udotea flabellum]